MCTHGTLLVCWCVHMVRCWCVHVYTWYAAGVLMCTHGTLLVCSCVHMVRCWCAMCKRITQSQCHDWVQCISSCHVSPFCLTLSVYFWCMWYIYIYVCILHVCLYMYANRVKWKRCKLQVIVDFSARFGEKNSSLDIVKTFNDQLHLKTWYEVYLWTTTFYMKKHSKINTMTTRTTNGCGYSSHVVTVSLVPSRANPPGGANIL